jgi:hypothetical protein
MAIGSLPRSNGRECWIFSAAGPGELFGVHGEAIAAALRAGEPLLHLVYFPIWDATATPFGQPVEPGSHALAVTSRRFILSINPHRRGRAPRVAEIPFDRLLAVEWGDSLLSGWAALHHAAGGRPATLAWMYRATGGRRHVAAALRAYRGALPAGATAAAPAAPPPAAPANLAVAQAPDAASELASDQASDLTAGLESDLPVDLAPAVLPLLLRGEPVVDRLPAREVWQRRSLRSRRPVCLSAGGLWIATARGLLLAERAPAEQRYALDCGTRCQALSWQDIVSLTPEPAPQGGAAERWLLLEARRAGASWRRWMAPGESPERFLAAIEPLRRGPRKSSSP